MSSPAKAPSHANPDARAHARDLGGPDTLRTRHLTPWSPLEDATLRAEWPRASRLELLCALPGRTVKTIAARARKLGLAPAPEVDSPELRAAAKVAARRIAVHHGSYAAAARALDLCVESLRHALQGTARAATCRVIVEAERALKARAA